MTAVLGELERPSALEAVASLRSRVTAFADADALPDDLCMLAASIV